MEFGIKNLMYVDLILQNKGIWSLYRKSFYSSHQSYITIVQALFVFFWHKIFWESCSELEMMWYYGNTI